jgi:hypothetical protein
VPAVDLSLPFAPLLDLVSGWSDGYTRRECRLPPLRLGVWVVSRVTLAGSALCPLADLGGPVGRAGYCFVWGLAEGHLRQTRGAERSGEIKFDPRELHDNVDVLLKYESMLCGREYEKN